MQAQKCYSGLIKYAQSKHSLTACAVVINKKDFSTSLVINQEMLNISKRFNYEEKPANWDTAKPFEEIPGPKPLPIIGNSWRFFKNRDFVKLGQAMRKEFGDIVIMRKILNFGDFLFLYNVKDIEWMLRNEGPYPVRQPFKSSIIYRHELRKEIFGDTYGLLNGQFEKWHTFRSVVNPIMMQPRVTQQYIPTLDEIADEFMVHLRKLKDANPQGEMPSNFIHEINNWAFESIVCIALDTRLGCLEPTPTEKSQKAMKYVQDMMDLIFVLDLTPAGFIHKKFKTKTWHSFIENNDFFTKLVLDLINDIDQRMKNDPKYKDKPEHEKSVFEKLVAKDKTSAMVMVLDMMSAGIETTGKVTGGVLYFLAQNKEVQEKLRTELIALLPSKSTPITKDILNEAKYLRATIKEALRVAPIAHSTVRQNTKRMVIGGYQIPPGLTIMMAHMYLSLGTDEHFKNPLDFRPERWLRSETKEQTVNPFVILPFGFGPRSCIGKRMANMEIEILVSKIVRNFYLDWPHKEMKFRQDMTYGIADPLKLRLKDVPQ